MSSTKQALGLAVVASTAFWLGACDKVSSWAPDPYSSLNDESVSMGAVDPVNFPPQNLGTGGDHTKPGLGEFHEHPAYVGTKTIGYFAYPLNTTSKDQLEILENGKPYPGVVTPAAYLFDGTVANPFPAQYACDAPANYNPMDLQTQHDDAVRLDQQGNIFTALPSATYMPGVASATKYIPLVAVGDPLSSAGTPCQFRKSEKALADILPPPPPSDQPAPQPNYLAWLLIDPAAAVYPYDDPNGYGLSLQHWGWYKRYLVAYLDGGSIRTEDATLPDPKTKKTKTVTRMVTQKLYVPREILTGWTKPVDAIPATATTPAIPAIPAKPIIDDGSLGESYDVLAAKRGDPGYSPLCEVLTYDTTTTFDPATMAPAPASMTTVSAPLPVDMLPTDAATIETTYAGKIEAASPPQYFFCLQVLRPE